ITYTITEATAEGFQLIGKTGDTGSISTTKSTAAFTNTRDTGDLELSKVLVSDAAADKDVQFTFTVKLGDDSINGTYGDMKFEKGVATVELKGGEKATATGLPTDITYSITEADAEGFQLTGKTGDTGTISTTKSAATFTNTRETGDLEVKKTVTSSTAADLSKDYSFTVTLSDNTINGTYGWMTFTNGVAAFTLKHGESRKAEGLPTGIAYEVVEDKPDGFIVISSDENGTIKTTLSTASFNNTKEEGDLQVAKTVSSEIATDKERLFHFTVTLDDTTINGTYGEMTFENGVAEFDLKDNQVKKATGLPKGVRYTVTEENYNEFTTTYEGTTGTISEKIGVAAFTNTRKMTEVTVEKIWDDKDNQSDKRPDNVMVQLQANGADFGEAVELNAGNKWKHTWPDLVEVDENGEIQYTVTEAQVSGYKTPVITKISDNGWAYTITNSITHVEVKKTDIANGEEVAGAKLIVTDKDDEEVDSWTTEADGNNHIIEGLKTGEENVYTLIETVAPEGYEITTNITFWIDETGDVHVTGARTETKDGETVILVEDKKTHVEISKVDVVGGEELEGATIQIRRELAAGEE
ncbi:T surface-antigen of pili, partial [Aristaeella hokkaidonensis]